MLSASVRHTSPSCGGDLFVADTDDLKPMTPFEIHVKNSSNQKRCTFKKWHWTCLPCKTGEPIVRWAVVIHRCVPSGRRFQAIISRKMCRRRRSPTSESRSWSFTRFLECSGRWHDFAVCCSKDETLCSEGRFSDTSELYGCSETNKNQHWRISRGDHRWLLQHGWR